MKRKLKVLALFDSIGPTTIDHDLTEALKTEDRKTERDVLKALAELGHETQYLVIFDDLDLIQQKIQIFQPDVIFNLADQFKNNRSFDQNIFSFLATLSWLTSLCALKTLILEGCSKYFNPFQ